METKQKLTTTLNRLKQAGACKKRYEHLVKSLGGPKFDHDAPINLLTILETNGTDDCLWALCATSENCDRVARLMGADFAQAVLPIYESKYPDDKRPRLSIEATRRYALGEITEAEWEVPRAAALAVAWEAPRAAPWEAPREAARAAAWAAARASEWAAVWAAREAAWASVAAGEAARQAAWEAAWEAQAQIIKKYLLP